jgi:hypothetical protein
MTTPTWISRGFMLSGMMNISGVLLASLAFTSTATLTKWDPGAFSILGLVCIMLWGMAYIAAANHVATAPKIALVFFIEKLAYIANYVIWFRASGDQLGEIYKEAWFSGLFFTIYGLNDLIFGLFFAVAFFKLNGAKAPDA